MKILLIEDNTLLGPTLVEILKKEHYMVDWSSDGISGMNNALTDTYDVIIIDWMLPQKDGIEIMHTIRKNKLSTPILMLTAKEQIDDKVLALDNGADDYLTKPFDNNELLARVRALSRRRDLYVHDTLTFNSLALDANALLLSDGAKQISLSLKESSILEMLMDAQGNTVLKENIIEKVWGYESNAEDNHVEVYISFLRRKLKNINSSVSILTVRGIGYMLKVTV